MSQLSENKYACIILLRCKKITEVHRLQANAFIFTQPRPGITKKGLFNAETLCMRGTNMRGKKNKPQVVPTFQDVRKLLPLSLVLKNTALLLEKRNSSSKRLRTSTSDRDDSGKVYIFKELNTNSRNSLLARKSIPLPTGL